MINFTCPHCTKELVFTKSRYKCLSCNYYLQSKDGVVSNPAVNQEIDKTFYDDIYTKEKGEHWFQGLNRSSIFKKVLEKISLSYRRERFFKNNIKSGGMILDLACGAGRDYFKNLGIVVGVDLSNKALQLAKERYDLVLQSGVSKLPFADNTFDYVVSSDFFGHVRKENKDKIIREIKRVLKPDGITLHVIETDSTNIWFRLAHQHPELFKKYFIEQIGGHVGLEMPTTLVKRWQENGFEIVKSIKIWGSIWPIQDYSTIFNNEYSEKYGLIKLVVVVSKILSYFKLIKVGVNILLNPVNSVIERFFSLNNGQGIMLVGKNIK